MLWVDVIRAGSIFDATVHLVLLIRWLMMAQDGQCWDPWRVRIRRIAHRPVIQWGGSRVLLNPTGLTLECYSEVLTSDLPDRVHPGSVRHRIQQAIRMFLREYPDVDNDTFIGALRDHLIISGWAAWRCSYCTDAAERIELLADEAGFISIDDWVDLASTGRVHDRWMTRARAFIQDCRDAIDPHTTLDSVRSKIASTIIKSVVSSQTFDEAKDKASRSVLAVLRFSPKFSPTAVCRSAWDLHNDLRDPPPGDGAADGPDVDVLMDVLLEFLNQCMQDDRTPLLNNRPIDKNIMEWIEQHHPVHRRTQALQALIH